MTIDVQKNFILHKLTVLCSRKRRNPNKTVPIYMRACTLLTHHTHTHTHTHTYTHTHTVLEIVRPFWHFVLFKILGSDICLRTTSIVQDSPAVTSNKGFYKVESILFCNNTIEIKVKKYGLCIYFLKSRSKTEIVKSKIYI